MKTLVLTFCLLLGMTTHAQNDKHEELGEVQWLRNYEQAVKLSKETGKDILILFQEVPGCETCRNYGHNVLSSPLMVEAIENLFVPLAIFNNLGGKDNAVLKQFEEYSWNNPTVRIVNHSGETLVPRIAEDYSALTLCKRMIEALHKKQISPPGYLDLLHQELQLNSENLKTAYFKVPCFWSGEAVFGHLDGVVETISGFSEGWEVVKVNYNSEVISQTELKSHGLKHDYDMFQPKQNTFVVSEEDQHYYLKHSDFQYLALSDIQKTKVNSALNVGGSAQVYLSPKQIQWYALLVKSEDYKKQPLLKHTFPYAWSLMSKSLSLVSKP